MEKLTKRDIDHLEWIYHRLINVHNENRNLDYMVKFFEIIKKLKTIKIEPNYDHFQ